MPGRRAAVAGRRSDVHFLRESAFLPAVEPRLLANLGQGDGAEQAPEIVGIRHLQEPALNAAKEGAARRLDHVFRADPPAQSPGEVLLRDPVQEWSVLIPEHL